MNDEGELPLILTSLLTMKRMVVIDVGQELLQVSLSHMIRTTTMSVVMEKYMSAAEN